MPQIQIDLAHCTGCGNCIEGCPMDVFILEDEKAKIVSLEDCIVCKFCETVCEDNLIQVDE